MVVWNGVERRRNILSENDKALIKEIVRATLDTLLPPIYVKLNALSEDIAVIKEQIPNICAKYMPNFCASIRGECEAKQFFDDDEKKQSLLNTICKFKECEATRKEKNKLRIAFKWTVLATIIGYSIKEFVEFIVQHIRK